MWNIFIFGIISDNTIGYRNRPSGGTIISTSFLIIIALFFVLLLFFLIIQAKLHPFVALLVVSLLLGMASGMDLNKVLQSMEKGMGETLGYVAVIVGLGAMFGQILDVSGGAQRLAHTLIDKFGEDKAPLALGIAGFIVAIPVFFDVGFVVLVPLIYGLTKKTGRSLLYYGIPLLAGLAVTHSFIPPTPGPLAAADLIGVNIGWVILFGFIAGFPAMLIAGPIFGKYIAKRIHAVIPDYIQTKPHEDIQDLPPFSLIVGLILVPLLLILMNTFSKALLPAGSTWRHYLVFIGNPFTALIIATLLSFYFLGVKRGYSAQQIQNIATKALEPAGIIILVTGAGGVFKQILIDSGVGQALGHLMHNSPLPPILLAYLIAAMVRLAQGSSTVAMITASGLVAPVIHNWHLAPPELGLIVIAIASGATILSHVNDSGFWMVNRYFGMSIQDTIRSWTLMETIISISGLTFTALLSLLIS